ncbi:MAG: hypothetical protein JWP91_3099 [Fibrobacteres bacterium]|nr:hypothetical protein [Fibrobacterota bacterium]
MKIAAFCLALASAPVTQAAIEFVWCPLFDRGAGVNHLDNVNRCAPGGLPLNDVQNLPDVRIYGNGYEGSLSTAIAPAIQNAYNKGVRVIDLPFVYGVQVWNKTTSVWADEQIAGFKWLEAVEKFNSTRALADKVRVRIRFQATAQTLFVYTIDYLPRRTGLAVVTGLPATEPGFGAWQRDGKASNLIPDLANPKIREAIGTYARNILTEAKTIAKTTTIESMTLVFDGGGETSLLPISTESIPYGFRDRLPFNQLWKLEDKAKWFQGRTLLINTTLKAFATQVHAQNSRLDGTGPAVKAAIFYQTWPGDGYFRGAFDFSSLLDGTGIDLVHHSMHPIQLPYYSGEAATRTSTREDAAIQTSELGSFLSVNKRKANITYAFDAEYSWPWYNFTNNEEKIDYVSRKITDQNATGFKNQADGSIRYGANGTTFCNWSRYDMEKGLYRPSDPLFPTGSTATAFDKVLSTTAKTSLGGTAALGPATRAIFISTMGKMLAEIDGVEGKTPEAVAAYPGSKYYKGWFAAFGISPFNERIDFITDKMLLKYPSLLSDYTEIFMPFETSKSVDAAIFNVFEAATDANKAKIRFQMAKDNGLTQLQTYDMWKFKVRVFTGLNTFANGILF